jgi:flagellar basal body-associated protein FliL
MNNNSEDEKTMKNILCTLLIFIPLIFLGCGSTASFSFLNEGISSSTATQAADIKLYTSADIGKPYIEVGGVSASFSEELDGKKYAEMLKKEAAKIGADAVVSVRQVGNVLSGIAVKFQ